MTKKSHFVKLILVLSVSMNLAVVGAVGFHRLRDHSPDARKGKSDHRDESLKLSPDQAERFSELRSDFHLFRTSRYQAMTSLREELLSEMLAVSPDQGRVQEILDAMKTQQGQLLRRMIQHLLAEKALLRPDQEAAFEGVLKRHIIRIGTDEHGAQRSGEHGDR